jgi:hypothetical protein
MSKPRQSGKNGGNSSLEEAKGSGTATTSKGNKQSEQSSSKSAGAGDPSKKPGGQKSK